jgi:predicted ATPase/transcriptional regulator with XRE-family HTH domain
MSSANSFPEWLKRRRRELDFTQEALAEQMNCSVVTISKFESGQRRPSKQMAGLLAATLRVPDAEREKFLRFARGLTDLPPSPSVPSVSTAYPTLLNSATPLIGREHELASVAQLLGDPACRLLTLVGPGGIGKTRLALQAARMNADRFTNGAMFVSLAGVSSANDAPSTIATGVGLMLQGGEDIAPQLVSFLSDQHLLLVLDNLEHLIAGGTLVEVLGSLLASAPGLKMLATSREPLYLAGEWVFRLQGLPVPVEDSLALQHSAVQLFIQAARRADVHYKAIGDDLAAITRICRMVEGMPLAIELAAAWASALTPREIADEITRSLDFLAAPSATMDAHQSSIRAVFDQSWRLLTPASQRVLAALSVFRNGFTRDAAAEIAGADLHMLASLQSKSLIQRNGEGRYDLHELVRQFAAEQLMPGEATLVKGRHTRHYLRLVNEAERELRSAEQISMLKVLIDEVDNVRAAWDWAVADGLLDEIILGMRGLARLYSIKSWNEEGVQRFGAAATLSKDASSVHLLVYQSWFHACLEEIQTSLNLLELVFARIEGISDPNFLIEPHVFRALVLYKAEQFNEAADAMITVREMAQQIKNRWFEGVATHALAYGDFLLNGETEKNYVEVLRAAGMLREEGDIFQAVNLLQSAAHIAIVAGRFDDAERLLAETNEITERLGNVYTLGGVELMRGQLALARGDRESARIHLERSLALLHEARASKQAADARALLSTLSATSANT